MQPLDNSFFSPGEDQTEELIKEFSALRKERKAASSPAAPQDWPEPEPISELLPPVEPFDYELLPAALRDLVADVSERMQVPADLPAATALVALAGVVNRRALIQPKRNDYSWQVVPNLWGAACAMPGFLKSPVITAIMKPLREIEKLWRMDYESQMNSYSVEVELYKLKEAAWRDSAKRAFKKGGEPTLRPADEPAEPKLRRLIIVDATFEALHTVLADNPAGVLVLRDELAGWLAQLDRQGREGERQFLLECWNGYGSYSIDRIGRGHVHVEHCCVSLFGGIQPARLRAYLDEALKDGPSNDGLIQRLQVVVWPDYPPSWQYVDRPPDGACLARAETVFQRLAELSADDPLRLRFDDEAQELFIEWLTDLEHRLRGDDLHPVMQSHLSKYRSLMPTIAGLLELAERAADGGFVGFEGTPRHPQNYREGGFVGFEGTPGHPYLKISLDSARRAAGWCEYLESHARRMYASITTPALRSAKELAQRIRKRKVGAEGTLSVREIYLKGWSGLDTPESVRAACDVLEDAGWLVRINQDSRPSGGRPAEKYAVNPRIWEEKK
jgi:putative DNA primase/helicase